MDPTRRLTADANPPRHVHTDEEEGFYVLDGEIEFEVGQHRSLATAGTFALVPRGSEHSFRVLTESARMLVIALAPSGAPGGRVHSCFESVGTPAPARVLPVPEAPDPEALAALAALRASS